MVAAPNVGAMVSSYADLMSGHDLDVLGALTGLGPHDDRPGWFRAGSGRIEAALDDPATFAGLFAGEGAAALETVTPILVFAAVVHRGANEIGNHSHLPERHGSGSVIPVFDGSRVADFASSSGARRFLVELLGSYTRVLSGPRWERTRGRWRRRRFSELNPAQLAQLAASLPLEDRTGAYRRLGDLALFLNGVFPDHASRDTLSPIELERLLASLPTGYRSDGGRHLQADRVDATGPVLAALGPDWYRLAARLVPIPTMTEELSLVADRFDEARRFLNFITDRYLFERRDRWFPAR